METTVYNNPDLEKSQTRSTDLDKLYVLYGSRTGNSESAARLAWEYAKYLGIECELLNMRSFDFNRMKNMKNLLIAVSTHGEGDPPAVVEDFYNYMHSGEAPRLDGLRFSVLALGDSSYKDYCKTGHDFRKRLLELGAKELSLIVECDIDFEEKAKKWVKDAVSAFEKMLPAKKVNGHAKFAFEINKRELDNKNAFYVQVIEKKLLTKKGYDKRTYHFTLSLNNFETRFHPGDSFGIFTSNSRMLVDKLLKILNLKGAVKVTVNDKTKLLKDALLNDFEITMLTPVVVKNYAKVTKNRELSKLIKNEKQLTRFCELHDVLDLAVLYPAEISANDFISVLRKLTPRLYSVAASPLVHPGELHLTASFVEYQLNNRKHRGVCSVFLDERTNEGDQIPLYYDPNEKFRLPDDDDIPIIMIGTGTGIAPFRGFMQERQFNNSKGANWLFFGDRYAESDFLYGDEILEFQRSGILTKLDLAFSRDQKEKKYVQHLMWENSYELFHWIDQLGALIYLCGNKRTMGKDVQQTLKSIILSEGKFSKEESNQYWERLKKENRVLADIY